MSTKQIPLTDNLVTLTLDGTKVTMAHVAKRVALSKQVVAAIKARGGKVDANPTTLVHAWLAASAFTLDTDDMEGVDLSACGLEEGETFSVDKLTRGARFPRPIGKDGKQSALPTSIKFTSDAFAVSVTVPLHSQGRAARVERDTDGNPTGNLIPRDDVAVGAARFTRPNGAEYILTVKVIPSSRGDWSVLARFAQ